MTDLSLNPEIPVVTPDAAPDQPVKHPMHWVRENLFSSVSNTIQTLLFSFIMIAILRWLLSLIVSEERDWSAVTTNMRLLFTYNYPASQYGRIWFSLGSLLIAAMFTVAAFGLRPEFSLRKILINVSGTGAFLILIGVLAPVKFESKLPLLIPGLIILAIGVGLLVAIDNPHLIKVKFWQVLCSIAVLLLAVIWFFPFGNHTFVAGEVVQIPGTIKQSTKNWLSLMVGITVAAFFFARWLATVVPNRPFRLIMMVWWVLGPAFLIFLVIRDPAFDWGYIVAVDIPIALIFGVGGGALLFWLAKPGREPIARAVGTAILGVSALTFILAFTGDVSMLQKVRLSILALGFVALLAPTFAGETKVRLRFALTWLALIFITHWLITGINTPSTLDIAAPPFLGGFAIPLTLGYYVMLASFPMGMLMALARTSTLPLFRVMSTIYIEGVRGVPLIVILFFFDNLLNLFLPSGMAVSKLAAIFIGYTLFSAAYMAENIRGGLQSVRRGQFEASDALGLTTLQRTVFIILPQALRVSIPNLVGQAIATFKETSLVAIIGAFDLLNVARNSIPNQPAFLGHSIAPLLFISFVYWVVAYSMSRASRSLEAHLGVGTR